MRPWATTGALIVIIGAAWGTAEWMGHAGWAALAIAFFAITLHRFFLPSQFCIDDAGVTARSAFATTFLDWKEIRHVQHDSRGVVLSSRRSLFAVKSVHLLFDHNRDDVMSRISERVAAGAAS